MTSYGILSHVQGDAGATEAYCDTIRYVGEAARIGYRQFWVAQHHFSPDFGHVSSPLVLLAHIGALHPQMRLGVGVVSLTLEDPVRLAEDIATAQVLLGDRLLVGVGPGNANAVFEAFGTTADDRHEVFAAKLARLRALIAGEPVAASSDRRVWPPILPIGGTDDPGWLSQATYTPDRARAIGESGLGLLLSVSHPLPPSAGSDETALSHQAAIVDAYLQGRGVDAAPESITATRAVFTSHDDAQLSAARDSATRWFSGAGFAGDVTAFRAAYGAPVDGSADAALLERLGFSIGTPEQVRRRLESDAVVRRAGTVLFQVLAADVDSAIESARLLHDEVVTPLALVDA